LVQTDHIARCSGGGNSAYENAVCASKPVHIVV
jgi:hypothetical protein